MLSRFLIFTLGINGTESKAATDLGGIPPAGRVPEPRRREASGGEKNLRSLVSLAGAKEILYKIPPGIGRRDLEKFFLAGRN